MVDVAQLAIAVDWQPVAQAARALDQFEAEAEAGAERFGCASSTMERQVAGAASQSQSATDTLTPSARA